MHETDLVVGLWNIEVSAFNAAGNRIGTGKGTVTVRAGARESVAISVRPLTGPGTLDLTVTWPAADVADAGIEAELLAIGQQTSTPLSITLISEQGEARILNPALEAGYYKLSVRLLSGGTVVAGASTDVRIAAGSATRGSVSFTEVNTPTGEVDVIITPEMNNPLTVTMTGAADSLVRGGTMTVSVSVSDAGSSILSYEWFLNGGMIGSGSSSITYGSTLAPGVYRLDVIAATVDGKRAGSATHRFTVVVQ